MRNRSGWQYATAGLFIAGIAAVISYGDGLFVARLAGNDWQASLYPLLPDGLIVVSLLALREAAQDEVPRSAWAQLGLILGITVSLALNVGAGLALSFPEDRAGVAHSPLDAILLGMVPVYFFITVEVVLWHVRRGRGAVQSSVPRGSPAASPHASLPSMRGIQDRQKCSPTTAKKIRAEVAADRRSRGGPAERVPAVPAVTGVPAGENPRSLAGASPNGQAHG